jgi:DNA-directed RNA polymerase specialized sigma subunit
MHEHEKEFLRTYHDSNCLIRALEMAIDHIQEQIAQLAKLTHPDGIIPNSTDDLYVQVAAGYSHIMDEMRDAINLRKARMDHVRSVIMQVPDEREQRVLNMRYLQYQKWDQISETMCYDVRQIHRIHNQALQHVELILNSGSVEHFGSIQPSPP